MGVEDGVPLRHPADRVDELAGVGDPILEQVADGPAWSASSSRAYSCSTYWDSSRIGRPGRSRRAASAAWSPSSVCDGGSRMSTTATSGSVGEQRLEQVRTVVDGRDHVETVLPEQLRQAVPEEEEVFGDDNAHGISMRTVVGPPGGLCTAMVPSNAASRRLIPRRPVPAAGSAPPSAVVDDLDQQPAVDVPQVDHDPGGPGVLDRVGQNLVDGEVGRRLHRAAAAAPESPPSPSRPPPVPAPGRVRRRAGPGPRAPAGGCPGPGRAAHPAPPSTTPGPARAAHGPLRDRRRVAVRRRPGSCPSPPAGPAPRRAGRARCGATRRPVSSSVRMSVSCSTRRARSARRVASNDRVSRP